MYSYRSLIVVDNEIISGCVKKNSLKFGQSIIACQENSFKFLNQSKTYLYKSFLLWTDHVHFNSTVHFLISTHDTDNHSLYFLFAFWNPKSSTYLYLSILWITCFRNKHKFINHATHKSCAHITRNVHIYSCIHWFTAFYFSLLSAVVVNILRIL